MNVIIVDDNIDFLYKLKKRIEIKYSDWNIECYSNISIEEHLIKADVWFLNIEYHSILRFGFIFAEKLIQYNDPIIIFISSHDELICEGYKYRAFRFLRKKDNLLGLNEALESIKHEDEQKKRRVKAYDKYHDDFYIFVKDIQYIFTDANYICIVDKLNCLYKVRYTMKEFICDYDITFPQCSSGCYVNPAYIIEINDKDMMIRMRDQSKIPLSKRHFNKVVKSFLREERA